MRCPILRLTFLFFLSFLVFLALREDLDERELLEACELLELLELFEFDRAPAAPGLPGEFLRGAVVFLSFAHALSSAETSPADLGWFQVHSLPFLHGRAPLIRWRISYRQYREGGIEGILC